MKTSFTATAILAAMVLPAGAFSQPQAPQARKSTEPPVGNTGKLCSELFTAIARFDAKGVDGLLAQGADPNSRNGLGFAPIYVAAASHQSDVVEALLKAGAKPDATSTYGTPLTFACFTGNVKDALRFLELGANPDYVRTDGMTPLSVATNVNCVPIVQALIAKKANVNMQDDGGCAPLHVAARQGFVDVGKLLIGSGAKIDLPDVEGQTPLMAAAKSGHSAFARMLVESGATVEAKDYSGMTPLLLAAKYGNSPDTVKVLLEAKARADAKDPKGRTAGELAAARGDTETAKLLGATNNPQPKRSAFDAVKLSLDQIAIATRAFEEGATCVSCHQEGLARIVTGEAKARGFQFDREVEREQAQRITAVINGLAPLHAQALKNPEAAKQLPLVELNEVSTLYGWVLAGQIAHEPKPTPALSDMAMCLARQQGPDGSWSFAVPRVPMQSSFFTFTAYAVQAMGVYGPKSAAEEIAKRTADAKKWLLTTPPQNSEDRASKLLGLKWAGASKEDLAAAADAVLKDQRPDGGWSQVPGQGSDAYATGQALYALRVGGGLPVDDPVYQQGVRYLLLTQDDDGSWFVNKRAIPVNNYFDSSFPHGESQYASFNGTCWAVLALLPLASPK